MKKRKFQKGAISVFLVIVLIPCMVISSMFVDMSRVVLAKGYASSAADLALNSLMANYDPDLSEYYGMVASCQDIDQFYEESAQYFLEALYSQGIDADDAESLLGYINAMAVGSGVHDLYKLNVQTETSKIVTPVEGASLGESAVIIKDDIVEFMKYRGPVEIVSKVITRLKNSNAASVLGTADEDEDLVEDKQEYATAEEDFMDAAYKTFKKVKEYEALRNDYGLDAKKMQKMIDDLKTARETYREVVKLMVSNLNGTSSLKPFKRTVRELNAFTFEASNSEIRTKEVKDSSGNITYYINNTRINKLLGNLEDDIIEFKEARKAVSDKVGETLVNAQIGSGSNQYNAIQWYKKVNSLVNSGKNSLIKKYGDAADDMLESYAKVLAIKKCTLDKDVKTGWEKKYNSLTQSVTDLQKEYLKAGVKETNGNLYLRLVNKMETHSKGITDKVNADKLKLADGRTVSTAIKDVEKLLSKHSEQLGECIDLLDTIANGGGALLNNPYSLESLSKKAKEYNSAYKTWKGTAEGSNTDLAKQDQAEIKQKEEKSGALAVSPDDILDFRTRVNNVKSKLKSVKDTIDGMKLGKKKLVDIDKYSTAYDAVKNDIGENLKNSAVSSKAEALFKSKFTPYTSDKKAAVANIDFSNKDYSPKFKENEKDFHKWMYDKFGSLKEDAVKTAKKKKDEKKKEGEDAKESAKNEDRSTEVSKTNLYGNSAYKGGDFPSGLDGNLAFNLGGGIIGSLGTTVKCLVDGKIDGIRDALYSTEYVMDMFSYATYVNEGKYRLGMETKDWSASDAEKAYEKNKYADVTGKANEAKTWLSEDKTDRYNKTLTNMMINSTNNVLHGAEVEYVLYGKTNKENVAAVYANIFAIRYALNTISGFQHFWGVGNATGESINLAANALSSATGGVVPAAAIKCVAILLITALETGSDLSRLQKGFQVEIYKLQPENWVCSIKSTENGADSDFSAKNDGGGNGCADGLFYSDYLYLFVLLGFQSGSASEMYRRTADLIQVNMRKYTDDSDYKLKNAKTYFQVDATIRVDPLMLALPMAQTYSNNPADRSDWCTFTIKEMRGYS